MSKTNIIEAVRSALISLGYRKGTKVRLYRHSDNCCAVFINNRYSGIFDFVRRTFVD